MTVFSQRTLALARSKHISERFFETAGPPVGVFGGQVFSLAWVMKTLLPQMTGVEFPLSGSLTFHLTFSVADHLSGRSVSLVCPWPVGPRNCGQLSALTDAASTRPRVAIRQLRREDMG